jgi:mannan endo-1,4-beta-mannosidase
MKLHSVKIAVVLTCFMIISPKVALPAESVLHDFITVRGDQLMEGDKPFRFISFNLPNLLMIEDNMPFAETSPWRLPDEFEIRDGLATLHQMGGTVARTYVLTVQRPDDTPGLPRHVFGPGRFNEEAFREFDLVLKVANEQGVRLIIPFVDNWKWQGGRAEYAGFRGKDRDNFWTDPQLIADFKETIRFVLLRTNTLTGVRYCDDKAILCWETGNEISPPTEWTREIARYIKSLDTNHLVMDGHAWQLQPESFAIPEIDIVTTHHYPNPKRTTPFAQLIQENAAIAKGKKPYVVGEFGFVSTAEMERTMKAIMDTSTSGGLLWSLRFRDRDGGFYWHSEPSGGNKYKGFHWPASTTIGAEYDETNLMAMTRRYAFAIRGLTPPPIPVPAPPRLLPIADAGAISWQGSVGAASYIVERAAKENGPWKVVGDEIGESFSQYHPLFADESVPGGQWFYRVRAKNESGVSDPSNVIGPVKVTHATLVDELADFGKVYARQGRLEIKTRDCRKAKEDARRVAGSAGDALIYRLTSSVEGFRVFTFFPQDVHDLKFAVSTDGKTYHEVVADKEIYFDGPGDYGYWKPVLYRAEKINGGGTFLKIEMTGKTQIGRMEISHTAETN